MRHLNADGTMRDYTLEEEADLALRRAKRIARKEAAVASAAEEKAIISARAKKYPVTREEIDVEKENVRPS